jgi:hypothetical protein
MTGGSDFCRINLAWDNEGCRVGPKITEAKKRKRAEEGINNAKTNEVGVEKKRKEAKSRNKYSTNLNKKVNE